MEPFYMTPSINGYCFYIDVDEYGFNFSVCLSSEKTTMVLHEEPCRGWSKEEIITKGKAVIKHYLEDILKAMNGHLAKIKDQWQAEL